MENTKKMEMTKIEVAKLRGMLSLLLVVILLSVSLKQQDIRYIGIGIMQFAVFYFGHFTLWSWVMYKRDNRTLPFIQNVISISTFVTFILCFLVLFIYGLSLFLHHYDIDGLINIFAKIPH